MIARRLGALATAVVLVAAAFAIRSARADDEPTPTASPPDGTDATATTASTSADRPVVCIVELRAVCDAVAARDPSRSVRTEPAVTTLAALADATSSDALPLWVTVRPFPAMADARRAAVGVEALTLTETAVASTPLVVAVLDQPRLDALDAGCGEADVWACVGEYAGRPWSELGGEPAWGTVRPAVGDVARSATALVSFAAATAGYFATTSFNRSTWEADTGFLGWLRPLARTVGASDLSGGTPLATMATRASAVDVAATTDAELAALGARASRFAAEYPRSAMSLDAVIAAPETLGGGNDLTATAAATLTAAGWGRPVDAGGPSASTTLALLELWEATT